MSIEILIDSGTKLISTACGILTLYLAWTRILPRLDEIHTQTNSLAAKAEVAAHAMGVQETLRQVAVVDPGAAEAARMVLEVAAERARETLATAAAAAAAEVSRRK
jgi:hypothetical protein